jgi:hypothetical protein
MGVTRSSHAHGSLLALPTHHRTPTIAIDDFRDNIAMPAADDAGSVVPNDSAAAGTSTAVAARSAVR